MFNSYRPLLRISLGHNSVKNFLRKMGKEEKVEDLGKLLPKSRKVTNKWKSSHSGWAWVKDFSRKERDLIGGKTSILSIDIDRYRYRCYRQIWIQIDVDIDIDIDDIDIGRCFYHPYDMICISYNMDMDRSVGKGRCRI